MCIRDRDNNQPGPFVLFVPKNFSVNLEDDYNGNKSQLTFIQRITAFADISAVRVADFLPDSNVVLVRLSQETLDLAVSQDIVAVEIANESNQFQTTFAVYAAMAPCLKPDMNGQLGIVHGA